MRRLLVALRFLPLGTCALAVALVAPGCRTNGDVFELQKESRMFEDEVRQLEYELEECCREKSALSRENEDLRRQLSGPGAGSGTGGNGSSSYSPPAIELPGAGSSGNRRKRTEAPRLEAPTIELPEPTDTPPATIPGNQEPSSESGPGPLGSMPSRLSINKRLTGGLDRDNAGGDEGIMVVLEPRDNLGRLVKSPGAVSVVLMDPAQTGDATRVARWDFASDEVSGHFHDSTFGKGLQFELPWPADAPKNRNLQLFVRCVTEDGTKLNADTPVQVRLASDSRPAGKHEEQTVDKDDESDASTQANRKSQPSSRLKSRAAKPAGRQARAEKPEWKPYR